MGCGSCSSGSSGLPPGCNNNGNCGIDGCDKLEVFDWLANMELPQGQKPFDVVEVRFKNTHKGFYRNAYDLPLNVGDAVAVESSPGHDIGMVSVTGELVRMQMKHKRVNTPIHDLRKVYRKANEKDIEVWKEARSREKETMFRSRKIASRLGLEMKISDVEFQGDNTKATFYYTAEGRVDFRQLIRELADEFKIRVEMRQIGVRQEAGRLGGIGSCGRELCCATWLTDFRSVSTSAARYQQLSLNPQKLAGQCGKLKCCLNYELDSYLDAIKDFPKPNIKLKTKAGTATHVKTDIFKGVMWYIYEDVAGASPLALEVAHVHEIIALNKKEKFPEGLKDFVVVEKTREPDYMNVVGQDSLTRFDESGKKKGRKKRKKKAKGRNRPPQGNKDSKNSNKPRGRRNKGRRK